MVVILTYVDTCRTVSYTDDTAVLVEHLTLLTCWDSWVEEYAHDDVTAILIVAYILASLCHELIEVGLL